MVLTLYWYPVSAHSRAVLMTIRALQLEVNIKHIDLLKGEQNNPEFLKINPSHTVPTIDDDGFILWESAAIHAYLVDKFGTDDNLYPKDPQKRAIIQRLLCSTEGELYPRISEWIMPQVRDKEKADKQKTQQLNEVLDKLDSQLYDDKFIAGDNLSIADHAILASLGYLDMVPFDFSPWMNIYDYLERCKDQLPYWEECYAGIKMFKDSPPV